MPKLAGPTPITEFAHDHWWPVPPEPDAEFARLYREHFITAIQELLEIQDQQIPILFTMSFVYEDLRKRYLSLPQDTPAADRLSFRAELQAYLDIGNNADEEFIYGMEPEKQADLSVTWHQLPQKNQQAWGLTARAEEQRRQKKPRKGR